MNHKSERYSANLFCAAILLLLSFSFNPFTFMPVQAAPALQEQTPEPIWTDGTAELLEIHTDPPFESAPYDLLQSMGRLDEAGMLLAFKLGDEHTFKTYNFKTEKMEDLVATLESIGDHSYIWIDKNQSTYKAQADAIRDEFEKKIYPTDVEYFGNPPDVDKDPRIHILIYDIQDDYDPLTGSFTYTGGYFDPADQSGQNLMEIFYMDCNPQKVGSEGFYGTIAHEFQHMIFYNYNKGNREKTWLNEGLSDLAGVVNEFPLPQSHLDGYREHPEKTLTNWGGEQEDYGASFLFVEYMTELVERNGHDIPDFTRSLVSNTEDSIASIDAVLSQFLPAAQNSFEEVFDMWTITNYASAASGNYRYTRPGLEEFRMQVQEDTNSDGFSDILNDEAQLIEKKDLKLNEWAVNYWSFQVEPGIAFVQGVVDGENNWWPWGNLDNPSFAMLVFDPSDNLVAVETTHEVDHTFTFTNTYSSNMTLAYVIASRESGLVDDSGDYNLKVDPSTATPDILAPTQLAPDLVGSPTSPMKFFIDATVKTGNGTFIQGLKADQFKLKIGGRDTTIISLRELQDKYVFEVIPPKQPAEGKFDLEVSVFGNPDTESQAVQYSTAGQSNVDVDLVIDRSGSMAGSPLTSAKNSGKMFVDLMNTNDMVGVVQFDHAVDIIYPLTGITAGSDVKASVNSAIDQIYYGGSTSIGGGLAKAMEQLTTLGSGNHPWAIVLLSDGQENSSPYVSEILPQLVATRIKVFSIGMGGVNEAQMQDIAYQTGGVYFYTPTDTELISIYNSISGQVAGRQTLYKVSGSVTSGELQQYPIEVDASVKETVFSVSWNSDASTLDFTLVSPGGATISPATADSNPDVIYVSGSTYKYYRITNPQAGTWKAKVSGVSAASSSPSITVIPQIVTGEAFNLNVQAVSNLTLDVATDKASYATGDAIGLQISLAAITPVYDARVTAVIYTPNGGQETMLLYDDGLHSDGSAADGVYGNFYSRTGVTGSYRFEIQAKGKDFSRFADFSVAVENASDMDWDNLPDNWEVEVGLSTTQDDFYGDPDGDLMINHDEYQSGTDPFTADTDFDLLLDGEEVRTYFTNPTNPDTDLGGVMDGVEVQRGTNPLDAQDDSSSRTYLTLIRKRSQVADTYEPNDQIDAAFGPLVSGATYTSYISSDSDRDFYWFDISGPGNVEVLLSNINAPTTDLDIAMYDTNYQRVGGSWRTRNEELFYFTPVSNGRFYLQIYYCCGTNTPGQPYTLRVTQQASQAAGEITGTFYAHGVAKVDVPVRLDLYDSSSSNRTLPTYWTVSDAAGNYHFRGADSLQTGQVYYVSYSGGLGNGYIGYASGRRITAYNQGSMLPANNLDLSPILLLSPPSSDSIPQSIPVQFTWTPRSSSPTESYQFNLYDPESYDVYFSTSPLGHVGSHILTGLPENFVSNHAYYWWVTAEGPNGEYYSSYASNDVVFSGVSAASMKDERSDGRSERLLPFLEMLKQRLGDLQ